jgi:hypothetical protein
MNEILTYLIAAPFGEYPINDESKRSDLQKIIDDRLDFQNDFRLYIEGKTVKKCMLTYDETVWRQNEYNERMEKMELRLGFKKKASGN